MQQTGPLTQKINLLENQKQQYHQQASQDIETRRAMHNAQLQAYDREITPLKRKARITNFKNGFLALGQRIGKMGPG